MDRSSADVNVDRVDGLEEEDEVDDGLSCEA